MTSLTLAERFWAKTRIAMECGCRLCATTTSPAGKCIVWTAAEKGKGYGAFWDGARTRRAHQVSYELVIGPVPEGLQIDHLCRVHGCVSPAHLEAVTHEENQRRGLNGELRGITRQGPRRRSQAARRPPGPATHCQSGHELTPANTYRQPPSKSHPNGRRRCRICKRAYRRRERQRALSAA